MKSIEAVDHAIHKLLSRADHHSFHESLLSLQSDIASAGWDEPEWLNAYQIHAVYVLFEEWLDRLFESEPVPADIVAFNFGLVQSLDNIILYLTGSKEWDAVDADWACNNDYFPEGKYFRTPYYTHFHRLIRDVSTTYLGMYISLAVTIQLVRSYVSRHPELAPLHVTVGFDDGNLYLVV